MRKKKLRLGDIYLITLPNGKFAFGRLFKESTLAIYKGTYDNASELPVSEEYAFILGVYTDLLHDGKWEIVGNRPFLSDDDAWPPPKCIKHVFNGKYSLYIKGEITPSSEEVCKDLERVAAWDRHHVVDRIMGDNKWNPE